MPKHEDDTSAIIWKYKQTNIPLTALLTNNSSQKDYCSEKEQMHKSYTTQQYF
jgi:hypothetical protein